MTENNSKWHLWSQISALMSKIESMEKVYNLRRRFNPHHPEEQAREESAIMRREQYAAWMKVKDIYAEHRDLLSDTLDNENFTQCKAILENIFASDLDEALRKVIESPDS